MAKTVECPPEKELYPRVAGWLKKQFGCFATAINTGPRHGRLDVVGLRDIGGNLSGRSEVISVEVKRGTQPFATSAGQAYGYSVYAERCYLAEWRSSSPSFREGEVAIAGRLGIGLLALRPNGRIQQVLSSPLHEPLDGLRLEVIQKMGYAQCAVCRSMFKSGTTDWRKHVQRSGFHKGSLTKAVEGSKGFVYWLNEVAERDPAARVRNMYYVRRYLCPDCVYSLFRDFAPDAL